MKYKLIFDFDNTLAYRDGMFGMTMYEILQNSKYSHIEKDQIFPLLETGFPWHQYEIPHSILFNGKSWWEYLENIIKNVFILLGVDEFDAKEMSLYVREKYLDISRWYLYSDTYETLEIANKDYDCYILSNHVPELINIVDSLQISQFIKKLFNSAIIGYEKPHYKIFQEFLKDQNISPRECIMIGDNYITDITGARSNSLNAILVRTPNNYNYQYYSETLIGIFKVISNIFNMQNYT